MCIKHDVLLALLGLGEEAFWGDSEGNKQIEALTDQT